MSIKSSTGTLPPLPYTREPITPLPETLELPCALGWAAWDAAVAQLDKAQHVSP